MRFFIFLSSFLAAVSVSVSQFNLTVDYAEIRKFFYQGSPEATPTFRNYQELLFAKRWGVLYQNLSNDISEECLFEYQELTLKTIAKWPTCNWVYAMITINENFDIPIDKLKKTWKNFDMLFGGFRIINTTFKNLSFLPKFETTCGPFGTYILNNSLLENADFIIDSYKRVNDFDNCVLHIANNPKLDATRICKSPNFVNRIGVDRNFGITDNKVDCGCQGVITPENMEKFKNCKKVSGKLVISGFQGDKEVIPSLSKITFINGDLEVFNTTLKSLSFLDNVAILKSRSDLSISRISIDIHDNPQMTRFGMGNLKNFENLVDPGHLNVNFQRLHPDFCLEIEEMIGFLSMNTKFINIEAAGYCNLNMSTVLLQNAKVCVFVSMSELDTGCVHLFGNLLIDSGDEEHVGKLENVSDILGSVTIQNTDLYNVKFLKNLKRIANLNESIPTMQILSNSKLRSLVFPNIEIFVSRYPDNNRVILRDNHPDLFDKILDCLKFQYATQSNVSINGGPCKSIPHTLYSSIWNFTQDKREWIDFDFDTKMDYSETGRDSWYSLYDTDLRIDFDTENALYAFAIAWKDTNDITALVGFLINILHLIVLLQRDLRTNFIYTLMIGIAICDVFYASTFITDYVLNSGWIYERKDCSDRPKYHFVISRLEAPIQEVTRKSSAVLAFLMALIRTLSVMMPTNTVLITVSKPKWAVLMVLAVLSIQGAWETLAFLSCNLEFQAKTCEENYNINTGFYVQCMEDEKKKAETDILQKLMMIDGNFTVFLAILYLIVTIILLNQLRTARNRRKNLKSSEHQRDNTSLLVTVMAITFFVSEVTYGFFFITQQYFRKNFNIVANILSYGQVVLWSLVTVNSSIHCLTCFFLSSQYRSVIWKILRIGVSKSNGSTEPALATTLSSEKPSSLKKSS